MTATHLRRRDLWHRQVGVLLCAHCVQQGGLLRVPQSPAVQLSPSGAGLFREWLGVERCGALSGVA